MGSSLALLGCLASTWFMTGLIWFVQVVHYPLFARVDQGGFDLYHHEHSRLTTYVVFMPMVLELITSVILVLSPPPRVTAALAWSGLAAAILVWVSTAAVQVPLHTRLGAGFDPHVHRALVLTNAVRAGLWTLHAGIVLMMTARALARD